MQAQAESAQPRTGTIAGLHVSAVLAFLAGTALVAVVAVLAWSSHESSEDRIIERRAAEAAAVLDTVAASVADPLSSAAELVHATGGDVTNFETVMAPVVADAQFVSASFWELSGAEAEMHHVVGAEPLLASLPPSEVLERLTDGRDRLHVVDLLGAEVPTLGYSYERAGGSRFVVYAEQPVAGSEPQGQPDAAFADLDYALYLDQEAPENLVLTNEVDLPIDGRRASEIVRLGDRALLLVVGATGLLGSSISAALPWAIVTVGVFLSAVFAAFNERALRRRDEAASLALQVATIAEENAQLYSEQRSVAQTLQQSLLLEELPTVPHLELDARYEVGAEGVDIGGDWYDVIDRPAGQVLLVVGDVSGRGIRAATVMAKLRYSIRAFASQGDSPETILVKLSQLVSVEADGHFATVVLFEVDPAGRTVTVVNAGHPRPLLLRDGIASFLEVPAGVPVGVVREPVYEALVASVPPGATLLAFTDGLFERRGETVDDGLERLRSVVAGSANGELSHLLDALVEHLGGTAHDDAAILGVRWPDHTTTRT